MADTVDAPLPTLAALPRSLLATGRDVVALTKPGITTMALIVGAGAMLLAPGSIGVVDALLSLLGIAMAVAGAGALNMWVERDVDALMKRTAARPLPAGRLSGAWALVVGGGLSFGALPLLAVHAGPLSTALTLFSLFIYVLVYTPMKRTSPWALIVGAVPGAMPALMGSTAVTGRFDVVGTALFFWVFLWQVPHFLAIAIYREREYASAGHKVAPSVWGLSASQVLLAGSALLLAVCGVLLVPLHVGGPVTAVVATVAGAWFVLLSARALPAFARGTPASAGARRVFFASLVYQTALFGALAVDAVLRRVW